MTVRFGLTVFADKSLKEDTRYVLNKALEKPHRRIFLESPRTCFVNMSIHENDQTDTVTFEIKYPHNITTTITRPTVRSTPDADQVVDKVFEQIGYHLEHNMPYNWDKFEKPAIQDKKEK